MQEREETLRIETATLSSALQSLDAEKRSQQAATLWESFLATAAASTVAVLMVVAGASLLIGRLLARREDNLPALGLPRQVVVWVAGFVATFVIFGVAPSEILGHQTQRSAVLIAVWALAAAVVVGAVAFVVRLFRQRKLRFRLVTLLAMMTGVAILASLWPLMALSLEGLSAVPAELWMPEKGWGVLPPGHLRMALGLEPKSWPWALVQWFAYDGWLHATFDALLLATLWFLWRRSRRIRQRTWERRSRSLRDQVAALLSFLGRSALGAAVCWGALYLVAAPGAIRAAESDFQSKISYCRDPQAHLAQIRQAQATVLESPEEMKAIRDQVRYDLYGEGEEVLERDFSEE